MHILVTGGSRGIGAACVTGAAARGWDVSFSYVADAAAAEATAAAARALGVRVQAVRADAAEEADTLALFDAAGPIDGVVANAGIALPAMPLAEMSAARIARTFAVNSVGAMLTAREAARRLPAGGSLVLVSSAAARLGGGGVFVDYAASKGALDTLTTGLANELGPKGIRVNGLRPGLIDTEIHASYGEPGRAQRLAGTIPMRRVGTAAEVAEAILWLLSPAAAYVSGTVLDVTGGR